MKNILILGASSAIAQYTARLFAQQHAQVYVVSRDAEKLRAVAADLRVRGAARVETDAADLAVTDLHAALWQRANQVLGAIDTVLIAYGVLPDQKRCEADYAEAARSYQVNFLSVVSLLTLIANDFENRRAGCIAVISSVAGDRGRQSNYIYGSAKGGLTIFLQGLRNRLARSHVTVLTIKPGWVATPMTAHLKRPVFAASPATVARGIYQAIQKKKDVVYLPGFWWWIMAILKNIPEKLFKRSNL